MRLAIFTNTYWPSVNGVAVSIANLREGLEALGHEVTVVAPYVPELDSLEDHPGVIRLPSVILSQKPDYPIALPSIIAMQNLHELVLDLVDVEHPWWVGKWGINLARRRKLPKLLTVHTQYELYAGYSPLPLPWTKSIMSAKLLKACDSVDLITTPGEGSRRRLIDLGVEEGKVIRVSNPTKLEGFVGANKESVRSRYGISRDEVLLGYIGRLNEEKNLATLIKAFGIVAKARTDVRLMVVGDGSERDSLERLAALVAPGRVIFVGAISHDLIAPYFAALDLFVTPSRSEVQPMSFAEAFASGVAIVAFNVTGCNDMIVPGESGVLVPLDYGERGLAEAVLALLADREALAILGFKARDWAKQFDQMVAVQEKLRVYEMLLAM